MHAFLWPGTKTGRSLEMRDLLSCCEHIYTLISLSIRISCVTRTLLSPLDCPRMYMYKSIILYIVLGPHGVWFLLCFCF